MTVDLFIKEYNKVADKEMFLKSHIVNNYIDYEKKVALCNNIIDRSMYIQMDGKKIFRQNTPVRRELFLLTLLFEYTDIEGGENVLYTFNELNKRGILLELVTNIPEAEYLEFNTLLDMMVDDVFANERDIVSYLDSKKNAIFTSMNRVENLLGTITEQFSNEE